MKICLVCVEIFAWGKYGGFGRATRMIGRELVKRGIEVYAVVPRRKGQRPIDSLDGIKVLGFPPLMPWRAKPLLKECDADIYHSCEPSLTSYLALKALPFKKHIVTVRDPRDYSDWETEFRLPSLNRWQVVFNFLFENNMFVRRSVKYMNGVYTTAQGLIPKVKRIYQLKKDPLFLPTPVSIPAPAGKAKSPTVCYLARLDRRKRPTLFLDLANKFPQVQFIVMGKSRDKKWEAYLRRTYANIPNLEFAGFVEQFSSSEHSQLLAQSWVMVNTATREGLPNAFLEAAAARCAILSHVNPDGFASRFGYHAQKDDFEKGLQHLIADDRWSKYGEAGFQYIKDTFELNKSIQMHIDVYKDLLSKK